MTQNIAKKFGVGLFVGRFQPFHKGHLHALLEALAYCDKLVIGVGSSNEAGTDTNPITAKCRIELIKAALEEAKIPNGRVSYREIPDTPDDKKWFDYVMDYQPKIEAVFSGNDWVTGIFKSRCIPVISPKLYKRDIFEGTKIRRLIKSGKRWESLVPKGTVSGVREQNLV